MEASQVLSLHPMHKKISVKSELSFQIYRSRGIKSNSCLKCAHLLKLAPIWGHLMGTTNEWFISASDKENPKESMEKVAKFIPTMYNSTLIWPTFWIEWLIVVLQWKAATTTTWWRSPGTSPPSPPSPSSRTWPTASTRTSVLTSGQQIRKVSDNQRRILLDFTGFLHSCKFEWDRILTLKIWLSILKEI